MSHSYRHTPIQSMCTAVSEKKDKRIANRTLRHKVKMRLTYKIDEIKLPLLREVSDVWGMAKDGKMWFGQMKTDPDSMWREYYRKSMRK